MLEETETKHEEDMIAAKNDYELQISDMTTQIATMQQKLRSASE